MKNNKIVIYFAIFSNILIFIFSAFYHKKAPLDVMDYLRNEDESLKSVYFFTECH